MGGRIEIIGSKQRGFIRKPETEIFWNGTRVGTVPHGGTFGFDIETDGELRLQYLYWSASLRLIAAGVTTVSLLWDRTFGRLLTRIV